MTPGADEVWALRGKVGWWLKSKGCSPEWCEDVSSDACLRAVSSLGSFRGESQLQTWVYQIAWNEVRRRMERREIIAEESLEELDAGCVIVDTHPTTERVVLARAELRALLECAGLTPVEREALDSILGDEGCAEFARRTGRPVGQVKSARHRLRKRLLTEAAG